MEESLIGKVPFYPEARMEAGVGTGVLVGRSLKAGVLSRVWRNYTPGLPLAEHRSNCSIFQVRFRPGLCLEPGRRPFPQVDRSLAGILRFRPWLELISQGLDLGLLSTVDRDIFGRFWLEADVRVVEPLGLAQDHGRKLAVSFVGGHSRPRRFPGDPFSAPVLSCGEASEAGDQTVLLALLKRWRSRLCDVDEEDDDGPGSEIRNENL
ncbi:hypothetical protein F2Q68_00025396 [Brassica cretica]|uniref:Uncharacterized protein n=1 Tax=Brassica cretica TaxID=69181 RepID=A0A8S9ID07_BRACR|nr:hypothetical protein F2Q68_00025396 [Brassica cretica]